MKRRVPVNKYVSAKSFRSQIKRTKLPNVVAVQRGGIRL